MGVWKRSLSSNRRGSPEHIAIIRSGRDLTGEERFWRLVDKRGPEDCWLWLGGTGGGHPRGRFWGGKDFGAKLFYSHRIAWGMLVGPIPDGLVIDHLCKNGLCQNPAHMRLVTQYVNVTENSDSAWALNKAKTHCKHGHPLSGENLRQDLRGRGHRNCRECSRLAALADKMAQRLGLAPRPEWFDARKSA